MNKLDVKIPTLEKDGWVLVSAEDQAAMSPDTFHIPPQSERNLLKPGDAARLLFDIETHENGKIIDRGIDRMWVIIKIKTGDRYIGVLDNNPGLAENLKLHEGDFILFGPEHISNIDRPPHEYIVKKYGASFFSQ